MASQQHSIQKVTLNLNCSTQEEVQRLQNQYLDAFQKKVLPELEQFFNASSSPDEVIKIDQLSINLGILAKQTTSYALAENMLSQIKKSLREKLTIPKERSEVTTVSVEMAKLEIMTHFLQRGYLPSTSSTINLQQEFIFLLQEKPKQILEAIKRAIRESGTLVLKRLSKQFKEEVISLLFQQMCQQEESKWLSEVKELIFKNLHLQSKIARQRIWQHLLNLVLSVDQDKSILTLLGFLIETFKKEKNTIAKIQNLVEKNGLIGMARWEQIAAIAQTPPIENSTLKVGKAEMDKEKEKGASQVDEIHADPNSLYGNNVGVILLHPFLKSFFEESQLLDSNEKFRNFEAAEKAVGLLHFMATGQTEVEECELSFQKIICGIPLCMPIQATFDISEAEKQETEKMLNAAIRYWSSLRNTKVNGLREAFLQREGKIEQDDQSIVLQVERKTMDILLDKIPWNTSIVKLPWLDKMIRVDWA